jgi:hypothetical protein
MRKLLFSTLILAAVLMNAVGESPPGLFDFLTGTELSDAESAFYTGGDVRMELDEARSRVKVKVYDNEYEARLGRIGPSEVFTVEAHNRIVETTEAPFYPVGRSAKVYEGVGGLTTEPVEFPSGSWNVTAVEERSGKYGPYMIKTDAVGEVQVYSGESKVGTATDGGYAMHSNSNDFSVSKSYGCVIMRQEDTRRVARTLIADTKNFEEKAIRESFTKAKETRPRQTIRVRSRRER